jgi:hypothetical protein
MPRIGLSITKSCVFRNSTQEFSNVYYFELLGGFPDTTAADGMVDEIANKEKAFHGSGVTFVRGRIWKQIGTPSQNEMISQKNLSGTGAKAPVTSMDKERAYLFRLRAGNDSRGNPVYLRKWYHSCSGFGTTTPASPTLDNSAGFSTAERSAMVSAMNTVGELGSGGSVGKICAKSGRSPDAGAQWTAHQFLEHHQLGDQWRAQ